MKLLFMILFVFLIVFGFIYFFFSDNSEMKVIEEYVAKLEASKNASIEGENATALSNYALENKVAYSVEIRNLETNLEVDVEDINKHIMDNLEVIVSLDEERYKGFWNPVDNKNIYILLRE